MSIDPTILGKLLPWQPDSLERAIHGIRTHRSFLDASETGVGKTAIAVGAAAQLRMRPMVICIDKAKSQWRWMFRHFGFADAEYNIESWSMLRTGKTPYASMEEFWYTSKTTGKRRKIRRFSWKLPVGSLVIFDEVHKAGGGLGTLQGQLLIAAKRQGYPCLGLSATAAATPLRMEALGYMLGIIPSPLHFEGWLVRNGYHKVPQRGWIYRGTPASHDALMRRVHGSIFGNGMGVRVRKKDVPLFPECSIFVEAIDFDEAQKIASQYATIKDLILQAEAKAISARDAVVAIVRARQHIELLKTPTFVEMVEELGEDGHSVIVFVNFRQTAFTLSSELACPIIIGGMKEKDVEKAHEDFQANRTRRLVMTYGAGQESLNLQDLDGNFPRYVLHNPSYSAIGTRQAVGRTHRARGMSPVIQKFCFAAGTVEESVMELNRQKLRNIDLLNDGDIVPLAWNGESYHA